jgi:hypothetical protein
MAEELDVELNQPSESEKRIKQLSGTVKSMAEERDAAKQAADAAAAQAAEVARERDFYAGFADVVSQNPAAKDHKDDILSKVKSGYTVEDAAWAVLGKAGKIGQSNTVDVNVAGGSAVNAIQQNTQKPVNEMTQAERLEGLREAEARGELSMN